MAVLPRISAMSMFADSPRGLTKAEVAAITHPRIQKSIKASEQVISYNSTDALKKGITVMQTFLANEQKIARSGIEASVKESDEMAHDRQPSSPSFGSSNS